MGYNFSFDEKADDIFYGVDHLNEIRSDIVSAGIAKSLDSVGDPCACHIEGDNIKIESGKVFFGNGIRLMIDDNGMSIPYPSGKAGTVWLEYVQTIGDAALRFTEKAPSGLSVKIAEIDASGQVKDTRQYCYLKNGSFSPNNNHYCVKKDIAVISPYSNQIEVDPNKPVTEVQVDKAGYQYMYLSPATSHSSGKFSAFYCFPSHTLCSICINGNYSFYSTDPNKGFYTKVLNNENAYGYSTVRVTYQDNWVRFYINDWNTSAYLNFILF